MILAEDCFSTETVLQPDIIEVVATAIERAINFAGLIKGIAEGTTRLAAAINISSK